MVNVLRTDDKMADSAGCAKTDEITDASLWMFVGSVVGELIKVVGNGSTAVPVANEDRSELGSGVWERLVASDARFEIMELACTFKEDSNKLAVVASGPKLSTLLIAPSREDKVDWAEISEFKLDTIWLASLRADLIEGVAAEGRTEVIVAALSIALDACARPEDSDGIAVTSDPKICGTLLMRLANEEVLGRAVISDSKLDDASLSTDPIEDNALAVGLKPLMVLVS